MTTLKRILPRLVFTMALGLFVFTLLYSSRPSRLQVQAQTAPIYMPRVNGNSSGATMSNMTAVGDLVLSLGSFTGNGLALTNVLEKNIAVGTNTWGNAVVNFSLGTQVNTNMAGDLTITGITGFNATNLNYQEIDLNPSGGTRLVAVPADWYVSGFTNSTTVAVTNGTWAKLRVEAIIGRSTNASIEPYL